MCPTLWLAVLAFPSPMTAVCTPPELWRRISWRPVPSRCRSTDRFLARPGAIPVTSFRGLPPLGPSATASRTGIARVTRIEDPIGHAIWTPVAKGHDLAVILWGLQDFFVGPSLDSTKDLINAGGLHVDMYSIPLNVWGWPGNAPLAGAAGRLPGNVYPSINDAGQVLELSMRSLPGFINPPGVNGGLAAEFESDIDLNELTGNGQSFVEITGGASAGLFDFDGFPMPGPAAGILGPLGYDITADMRLQFDSNPTNVADWTVESDDPVQGHGFAIPEPLTIAGVFAGICGLGGYLRKRRIA